MYARLLSAGLMAMLVLGCVSPPESHGSAQSSINGTMLVRSGFVTDVRDVAIHDHSSNPAAPAIGAVVGGVAGSMLGSGSGRALAAIGGAAGGSMAAQQLAKPGASYLRKVSVRFDDGQAQIFDVGTNQDFRVGDAVKIVNRNGNIQLER